MSGTIFLTELSRKFGVCMLSVAQSVPYQFNHTVLTQFTCHCEPRKKQSLPRRPHTSPLPISLSGHGIQTMLSGPKIQTEIVWIFGPHPPKNFLEERSTSKIQKLPHKGIRTQDHRLTSLLL